MGWWEDQKILVTCVWWLANFVSVYEESVPARYLR